MVCDVTVLVEVPILILDILLFFLQLKLVNIPQVCRALHSAYTGGDEAFLELQTGGSLPCNGLCSNLESDSCYATHFKILMHILL